MKSGLLAILGATRHQLHFQCSATDGCICCGGWNGRIRARGGWSTGRVGGSTAGEVVITMREQQILGELPHVIFTTQQVVILVKHDGLPILIEYPGSPA